MTRNYEVIEESQPDLRIALWKSDCTPDSVKEFNRSGCDALRLSGSNGVSRISTEALLNTKRLRGLQCNDLPAISNLNEVLEVHDCLELLGIDFEPSPPLHPSTLLRLKYLYCDTPVGIPPVGDLPSLEVLNTAKIRGGINDLFLTQSATLRRLAISDSSFPSLEGVFRLPRLEWLDLYGCRKLTDISHISGCLHLTNIELQRCKKVEDFSAIILLPSIRSIVIESCGDIGFGEVRGDLAPIERIVLIACKLNDRSIELLARLYRAGCSISTPPRYLPMIRGDG